MAQAAIHFEAIKAPKGFPNLDTLENVWMTLLTRKTGPDMKKRLEKFAEDWKEKPAFSQFSGRKPDELWVEIRPVKIGTGGKLWLWVSLGTRRRTIIRRRARFLHYRKYYHPLSRPYGQRGWGRGGYGPAGTYSGPDVYATSVDYPGIAPRYFEKRVAKDYASVFSGDVKEVTRIAAGKIGSKRFAFAQIPK